MTTAHFNRYFPFFTVALVASLIACIAPGQTSLAVVAIGNFLAVGLITDITLAPLPPQHRTAWPLLLTWSCLLIGLVHYLPTIQRFGQ